MLNNRVCLSIT